METFPLVEIFPSLQGEGFNTGKRVTFVRFAGCDLACPWCDTDRSEHFRLDSEGIVKAIHATGEHAVILTGGEPFIQPHLEVLLTRLKADGLWIGLETNGLTAPSPEAYRLLDYIAVSPKAAHATRYDTHTLTRANEVRIVVDGAIDDFCHATQKRIAATHYFLSPCERDGHFNFRETIELLGRLNATHPVWHLSVQTHKLALFR